MKYDRVRTWGRIGWRVLLTWLACYFVAALTLKSVKPIPSFTTFLCLWGCGGEELRDTISNILLFVPLGWVLRYWVGPRIALALCVVATLGIEAAQAFILIGRDPSLRDILTNALGGWCGIWLYDHWRGVLRPDTRTAVRFGTAAMALFAMVLTVTGIGLWPTGSTHPWFGHWGNHLAFYAPFDGAVKAVDIDGWVPPAGPIPSPNPLEAALARDSFDVHVTAINRTVTRPTALIFAVLDEFNNEMLFVGGAWRSAQLQSRTHFSTLGLRGLSLRLPLNGSEPGDSFDIIGRVRPDRWELSYRSSRETDSIVLPLSVGLGWSTILPAPLAIAYEWYLMNALWIATLLAPAAYWLHRSGPHRTLRVTLPASVAILLVVPLVLGVSRATVPDWIGVALGIIFGVLFARRSLRRHPVP